MVFGDVQIGESIFASPGRPDMTRSGARSHRDLQVYRNGFDLAMRIFELSKDFPSEERYSLTDQIRRSSRSVCVNIGEA